MNGLMCMSESWAMRKPSKAVGKRASRMREPDRAREPQDDEERSKIAQKQVLDHVGREAPGERGDVGAEDEDGSQD